MTRDPERWLASSEQTDVLALMRVGAEELAPPEVIVRVDARLRAQTLVGPVTTRAGTQALAVALLAGAGLALYLLLRPSAPASVPTQVSTPPQQTSTPQPAPAEPPQTVAPQEAPREQAPPAARPRRTRTRTPEVPSAAPADARLEEARLLEQARQQLSAQPDRALTLLREHASKFPQSWLEEERAALQVLALVQLGQRAAAHAQLAHFKARYPHSVQLGRLERALTRP